MTTILTSSIPDALDYILSVIRGLSFATANPPVLVFDGLPDQPDNPPDNFVSIGGSVESVVSGQDTWQSLGGAPLVPTRDENYTISAYISCYRGGSGGTDATVADAQKAARDAAFVIYRAIETALRGDPKLGTVIATGWASFADVTRVLQTAYGDYESGMGRSCTIEFDIAVYRRKYAT